MKKVIIATSLTVMLLLILAFTLALNAHAGTPKTVTLDKTRTVVIKDVIGDATAATAIYKLVEKSSTAPIDIVLSSPGGSILAGLTIESALKVAQTRGVRLRCHVPVLAASMAYYLFTQCDERYALRNASLLFHPARVSSRTGFTQDELRDNYAALVNLEQRLKDNMQEHMDMDEELFEKHYKLETLWAAIDLARVTKAGFINLMDDIINVPADSMFEFENDNPLKKLFGRGTK